MKTKPNKLFTLTVIALFILPVLAACSGKTTINVKGDEQYQMVLSRDSAKAGEITFHFENTATDITHEMVVVKTDTPADQLPLDADGNVDETQIESNIVDEVEDVEPGTNTDLTVNLEPGHYVLMCNLPGHYAQGMRADFTVN